MKMLINTTICLCVELVPLNQEILISHDNLALT